MTEALTLKEEADWIHLCFRRGLIGKEEVIAWADSVIEAKEAPHPQVIEIAMAGGRFTDDVLRLLESIPGTSDPKRVRARLFRSMRRDLAEDETKLQRITRILFQMAVAGDSPTPKAEAEMFGFDDAVELAAGGVFGNIGAVRREVLTFLDRWEQ